MTAALESAEPDDELVDRLLARRESRTFDCKRVRGVAKILDCVVAFANTGGGTVAVGLEDPDKAAGRDRVFGLEEKSDDWDEVRRKLRSRITSPGELPVEVQVVGCTLRTGELGTVGILIVSPSRRVHSIVDGPTFIRLDRGNRQIGVGEITDLAYARGAVTAETQLEPVDFELLETDAWRAYRERRRLTRPIAEALYHAGLAKRCDDGALRPTRAAVLLFAEDPSGLLAGKAAVRVFHFRGAERSTDPNTNLVRPPVTVSGPLHRLIPDARDAVLRELAGGVHYGPLGFEIAQDYPVRVVAEAITNAVIHRDYRLPADVMVRVFSDRIEVESPGLLPGPVTTRNIRTAGSHARNPLLVRHLREFPDPPNLDGGEGVPMMFDTMRDAGLYPPIYASRPLPERQSVRVALLNQHRPSVWEQVSDYLDRHGTIANAEVRRLRETDDTLGTSKLLRTWVDSGLLVVANPDAGKSVRRYAKPDADEDLFD